MIKAIIFDCFGVLTVDRWVEFRKTLPDEVAKQASDLNHQYDSARINLEDRAKAYAKQKGITAGKVAVIIQLMTQSDSAGVAFSVHPVTKNKTRLVIEVVRGLGDKLVSGTATPDTYVIDKKSLKLVEKHLTETKPILSEAEIKNLAEQVIKLEKLYGFPIDVEWMIKGLVLFIMQCRPITTLG